jgi:hypothetical protein
MLVSKFFDLLHVAWIGTVVSLELFSRQNRIPLSWPALDLLKQAFRERGTWTQAKSDLQRLVRPYFRTRTRSGWMAALAAGKGDRSTG